jgi:hypothetical protein
VLENDMSSIGTRVSCPTKVLYRDKQNAFLKRTEFTGVPEYLVFTIENSWDEPADCETIFIEKNYDKLYDRYVTKNFGSIYQPITSGENSRWERIPFEFDGAKLRQVSKQRLAGLIYLENNLTSAYEFTPGTYRLVVKYSDGSYDRTVFRILSKI